MYRLLEMILGLQRDVLAQQGEYALTFDPVWPGQAHVPAALWNMALVAIVLAWVVAVYRREGATRRFRVFAGALRLALLLVLLVILNRPMLSLTQARTEPSVLAVLVDDSLSMQVNDAPGETPDKPGSRLAAVQRLLSAEDGKLLAALAATHEVRVFRFAGAASPVGTVSLAGQGRYCNTGVFGGQRDRIDQTHRAEHTRGKRHQTSGHATAGEQACRYRRVDRWTGDAGDGG